MRIKRRKTRRVRIGNVDIGRGAPVSIQSMAKTKTSNVASTVNEIERLAIAGCQIVRLAIKDRGDLEAFGRIKKNIKVPLVADIHFNYKLALGAIERGADAIRLNPGNIYKKNEIKEVIKMAKIGKIPIRIGVNSGSLMLDRRKVRHTFVDRLMVKTALDYIRCFEGCDFYDIIISLKSSDVFTTISAYKSMAKLCEYPFHLGLTATGLKEEGIVKSVLGIGSLLLEGIGDTIRVSLTSDSIFEVEVAKSILQSLGLRSFGPEIISCPTCSRCQVRLEKIVRDLRERLYDLQSVTCDVQKSPFSIAIMGCEVNGPGEAKSADIGIAAGKGVGLLFKKGKIIRKVKENNFVEEILKEIKTEDRCTKLHRQKQKPIMYDYIKF